MTKKPGKPPAKRRTTARELGLPESILKLFPKTSRMGRIEPSQWGQAKEKQPSRKEADGAPKMRQELYR